MKTLHYICGRKVNQPITYCNNIYGNSWNIICVQLKVQYYYLYYPIQNLNVKIDDAIHSNDIRTYHQGHGKLCIDTYNFNVGIF